MLKGQTLVSPSLVTPKTAWVRGAPGQLYFPEEGDWPSLSWYSHLIHPYSCFGLLPLLLLVVHLAQMDPNKESWFLAPGQVILRVGLCSNMVGALLHGRIPQTQYYPKAPQTQYSPGNSMRVGSHTLCCVGESPLELCLPPDLIPLQITIGLALVPCLPHRIFSHSPRWAHFGSPLFALLKSAPSQALRFSLPTGLLYAPFPFLTEVVSLLLSQISGLPFQI